MILLLGLIHEFVFETLFWQLIAKYVVHVDAHANNRRYYYLMQYLFIEKKDYSNMTSFFRFVDKRAIYRLGIFSLAHAPVHVTDFPVVNVHVDELSSTRIWQHKLCAILSASLDINYLLPIKVCYRICTLRHIRIEIIHVASGSG